MSFQTQQSGVTPKKDTPAAKQRDKAQDEKISAEDDMKEAVDTSEWADEDEADINLAEKEDDPDKRDDVEDRKMKSAKPAKQQ